MPRSWAAPPRRLRVRARAGGPPPGQGERLGGLVGKALDRLGGNAVGLGRKAKAKLAERERAAEEAEALDRSPLMRELDAALDEVPLVGGILKRAVRKGARELQKAVRSTREVVEAAAAAMRDDRDLMERMGGAIQVGMPVQQTSSSATVGGVATQTVLLLLPVQGPAGTGQARVSSVTTAGGDATLEISVTTPDGRFTIMMPHPERVFRTIQLSWAPKGWPADSPWLRLFRNARAWLG